jgi:hypothetical protein
MGTTIRPEISKKNKYWISKHRYYELKHFCLQYKSWRKAYTELMDYGVATSNISNEIRTNDICDPTARLAITKMYYMDRIELVEKAAIETDQYLYKYIIQAVTEGYSFSYLKARLEIPCSRDVYYEKYRKFFWVLSQMRD